MTERQFRYLLTALLVLPFIATIDVVVHPITPYSNDLREIFYLLLSIPILFLAYCAWYYPKIIRDIFGPLLRQGESQPTSLPTLADLTLIGISLGTLLVCGLCGLSLNLVQGAGLLPSSLLSPTPVSAVEALQTASAATNQATPLTPVGTPSPVEDNRTLESALTETSTSATGTLQSPTATSLPASATCAVGEQCLFNGIAITVLTVSKTDSIGSRTAASGNTYLVLEVLIENIGYDSEMPYGPLYFSVQDAESSQYQVTTISPDPSLSSGTLQKGDSTQRFVSFEVKSTATGLVATYDLTDIVAGYGSISIDLGQ